MFQVIGVAIRLFTFPISEKKHCYQAQYWLVLNRVERFFYLGKEIRPYILVHKSFSDAVKHYIMIGVVRVY